MAYLLGPQRDALSKNVLEMGPPPHNQPHAEGVRCPECDGYRQRQSARMERPTVVLPEFSPQMREELRKVLDGEDEIKSKCLLPRARRFQICGPRFERKNPKQGIENRNEGEQAQNEAMTSVGAELEDQQSYGLRLPHSTAPSFPYCNEIPPSNTTIWNRRTGPKT